MMYDEVSSRNIRPVDSKKVSCLFCVSFHILVVSPRIPIESQESILGLRNPLRDTAESEFPPMFPLTYRKNAKHRKRRFY